jgi:hypothetical protein
VSYRVGGIEIPLPTTDADTAIVDPVVAGLLDYFSFWITYGLGGKGIQQRPAEITDVLPMTNRHPFDPRGTWVRDPKPALYLWWPDRSPSKRVKLSTVRVVRERKLQLMYVLAEVQYPDGARVYSGMTSAVDAILMQSSEEQRHPAYGYNGAPVNTPITQSLAPHGMVEWEYLGGVSDFAAVRPATSPRPGGPAEGNIQRGFPVLFANFKVLEKIEPDSNAVELMPDVPTTITTDGVVVIDNYLPAPDGSEENA